MVLLSCIVLIPSTDETEAAPIIEITDVSVNSDNWPELHSYTDIQTLKDDFKVTANVDGTSRILGSDEFYLSLGGPLQNGTNTFYVIAYTQDGQDIVLDSFTNEYMSLELTVDETYTLSGITATQPTAGKAYASTTEAEFRQIEGLSVTATFTDSAGNTKTTTIEDYSLTWTYDEENQESQGYTNVTVSYGNPSKTYGIHYYFTPLIAESIDKVESNGSFESRYHANDLQNKDKLEVTAVMNDQKVHLLESDQFNVTGSTFAGMNGENTSGTFTVSLVDDPNQSKKISVPIEASTPISVIAELYGIEFHAFTEPTGISVQVIYSNIKNNVTEGLSYYFYKENPGAGHKPSSDDGHIPISKLEANGDDDYYYLIIAFTENKVTVYTSPQQVKVTTNPIPYPVIENRQNEYYDGTKHSWRFLYYNYILEENITCSNHPEGGCGCASLDDETGALVAKNVGTYGISFTIPETYRNSYTWSDESLVETYYVTIDPGEATVTIVNLEGHTYGQSWKPTFTAKLGETDTVVTDQISWDKVIIQYRFKQGEIQSSIDRASEGDDEDWEIRVVWGADATSNLEPGQSEWFAFHIDKDVLVATATDVTYDADLDSQTPKITVNGTYNKNLEEGVDFTFDFSASDAWTYDVPLTLTPEGQTKYAWENSTGVETTVEWTINPIEIDRPALTDSLPVTYKADDYAWTVGNYLATAMDYSIYCGYHGSSDDCVKFSDGTITARDVGEYTVTFSLKKNDHGGTNYEWNSVGPEDVDLTVKITQYSVGLTVGVGPITYGDPAPKFISVDSVEDDYDLNFDWLGNDGYDQLTGFSISTTYNPENPSYRGVGDYGFIVNIDSRNYERGDIKGVLTVNQAQLTISKATTDVVTYYGDDAPDKSDYSFTIEGNKYDDLNRIIDSIMLSFGSYSSTSNAGDYDIIVTVENNDTTRNYTITIGDGDGVVGTLDVNPIPVALTWDTTSREFVSTGVAPEIQVAEYIEGVVRDVFNGYEYVWTPVADTQNPGDADFNPGEYTLTLTLKDEGSYDINYEWTGMHFQVTPDGAKLTLDVTITNTQIVLELDDNTITYREMSDVDFLSWVMTNISIPAGTDLGDLRDAVEKAMDDESSYHLSFTNSEGDWAQASSLPRGSYTLTVTLENESIVNRYVYATSTITVNPAKVTIDPIDDKTYPYNNEDRTITVNLPTSGDMNGEPIHWEFSVPEGVSCSVVGDVASFIVHDADTYTISFTVSAENYEVSVDSGDYNFSITVNKGNLTPDFGDDGSQTGADVSYEGTYGGFLGSVPILNHDEPIVSGVNGESIGQDNWTFTLGSEKYNSWEQLMAAVAYPNADGTQKTYTVEYLFQYKNYNDLEGQMTFTVLPHGIDVTMSVDGNPYDQSTKYVYNTNGHSVMLDAAGVENPQMNPKWSITVHFTPYGSETEQTLESYTSLPICLKDAGEYRIVYTVSADYHVTETLQEFDFTIMPADIEFSMSDIDGLTYTGNTFSEIRGAAHGVGSPEFTYVFTVTGTETDDTAVSETVTGWTDLKNVLIDAGSYEVLCTVSAPNHATNSSVSFHVTIANAKMSVSPNLQESYPYSGAPIVSDGLFALKSSAEHVTTVQNPAWTFEVKGTSYNDLGVALGDIINAGEYTITYSVSAKNHDPLGPVKIELEIARAVLKFDENLLDQHIGSGTPGTDFDSKIIYGDDAPSKSILNSLVTGFVRDDTFGSVFVDQNVTINYAKGDGAGSTNRSEIQYTVSGETLKCDNYNVEGLVFDFEVGKFAVTVTMNPQSTQYGILFTDDLSADYSPKPPFKDDVIIVNARVVDAEGQQVYVGTDIVPRGKYTITADKSVTEEKNYIIKIVDGTFTVGKRTIDVVGSSAGSVSFDGNVLDVDDLLRFYTITAPETIPNEDYVFTFDGHDPGWTPRDVGTYRVTISLDKDSNYTFGDNPSAERYITITHAVYDITLSLTGDSTDYNGQGHSFVLLSTSGGTSSSIPDTTILPSGIDGEAPLTVTYYVDGVPQEGVPILTDAGMYNIRAVLNGSPNFKLTQFQQDDIWPGWESAVLEATFTIEPYTIKEDNVKWTVNDFTYNGSDQSGYVQAWIVDLADSDDVIYLELDDVDFTHYKEGGYEFRVTGIQSGDLSKNYKLPKSYDWTNVYTMKQMTVTIGVYDYRNDDTDTSHNGVTYGSPPEDGYEAYGWDDMVSEDIASVYGTCRENMITNAEASTPDYSGYNLIDVLVPVVEYSDEYIAGGYDDYNITPVSGDLFVNKRAVHIIVNDQSIEYTSSPITAPNQNGDGTMYWHYSSESADIIEGDSLGIILTFDNVTPVDADTYENAIIAAFYNLDKYPDNNNYTIIMDQRGDFIVDPQRVMLVITPYSGYYTGDVVNIPYAGYTIRTSTGTLDRQITWGEFTYTLNGDDAESIRDAGEYTVHYTATLKNYALYDSADDTVPNAGTFTVTISQAENWWVNTSDDTDVGWREDYQYGGYTYSESPVLPTGSFTSHFSQNVVVEFYRGEISDANYLGTLGDPDHPWQFTNTTPAGDYTVRVKVPGNTNFMDLIADYPVHIERFSLDAHWQDEVTYLRETGESATNKLIGYDPELMRLTLSNATIGDDGTVTVTEFGTYSAILTLTDESFANYMWEGRPDDQSIECTWYVVNNAVENHWDTVPSIRDWTYGDAMPSYTAGEATYGGVATVKFYLASDTEHLNPLDPVDAGEYVMVSTVPAGETEINGVTAAYQGLEQETEFTIHPYRVSVPDMMSVEYTGEQINVPYEDSKETFYGKEVTAYTVTGDAGKEIGDYSAKLSLSSTNFVWSDGTSEDKTVTWRIVSGGVPTYADFAIDDGDEVYTGHSIEKNVICLRDGWNEGEHYTVTHTDNVNAGTATVTVSGTAFNAATGESTPWSLTFNFEIVKADPVLDFVNEGFTSYEDNGTFELRPYLSGEAGLSDLVWTSSDESVATVDENGIVTLRGLGTATITAKLLENDNWHGTSDSYTLTVNETQTEIVVVPGPGGSGGSGDGGVIYIPTVIREDAGISDMTWLIILACVVVVMLALIWLLWNRRTEGDGA